MDGASGSCNADISSSPSFPPFEEGVYLRDYEVSLDMRRFQAVSARGDSLTAYDVRHGVNGDTPGGT